MTDYRRWPDTLPGPSTPSFSLTPVDQSRRTDMEVGAQRVRRITKSRLDRVTMEWRMKPTEADAFRNWHEGLAVSLAGASDDIAVWALANTTRSIGAAVSPEGIVVDRALEAAATAVHRVSYSLTGANTDNLQVQCRATIKAAGRTNVRLFLLDRAGTAASVDIDLTTGALSNLTGLTSCTVQDRGNGWWRVTWVASTGTGASVPIMRFGLMQPAGTVSYLGDITKGIDICEVQARIVTGYDLFVPSDANGLALGADGGAAWFWTYISVGGGLSLVEARFTGPYKAAATPGLNRIITAELEVRNA